MGTRSGSQTSADTTLLAVPLGPCTVQQFRSDGCCVISRAANPIVNVSAIKPHFVDFPADAFLTTKDAHHPELIGDTGKPSGKVFCNTPFDLFLSDAEPELGVDAAGKQI